MINKAGAIEQFPYFCGTAELNECRFLGENGAKTVDSRYTYTGTALAPARESLGRFADEDGLAAGSFDGLLRSLRELVRMNRDR